MSSTEVRLSSRRGGQGRWPLAILRVVATGHLIVIFAQPVFAGMFLGGDYDMLRVHAVNAIVVLSCAAAQVIVALVVWWRRGPRWPSVISAGLALGEIVQYEAGQADALPLHLPLGVVLVVTSTITVVALWRPHTLGLPGAAR